jgi:hypothetical protein
MYSSMYEHHPYFAQHIVQVDNRANMRPSCETWQKLDTSPYSPTFNHEEIGSLCHRSDVFGGEDGFVQAEGEWAQSEVGEGVEEVWERSVSLFDLLHPGDRLIEV